jgi:hypothetical protein
LALRARADSSLALGERGTGAAYVAAFDDVVARLGGEDGSGGLLATARAMSNGNARSSVDAIAYELTAYRRAHDAVRALDDAGSYDDAVALALSEAGGGEAAAATRLNLTIEAGIGEARGAFDRGAAESRDGFTGILVASGIGTLVAAALVLFGFDRRIGEFR